MIQVKSIEAKEVLRSKPLELLIELVVTYSSYAAINVMPHLPLYGNRVGIQRSFDGKLRPKGGAFDFGGDLISTHASRIRARVWFVLSDVQSY